MIKLKHFINIWLLRLKKTRIVFQSSHNHWSLYSYFPDGLLYSLVGGDHSLVSQLHPPAEKILLFQGPHHRLQQLLHLAIVPPQPVHGKARDTHQIKNSQGGKSLFTLHGRAGVGWHHGLTGEGQEQGGLSRLLAGLVPAWCFGFLVNISNFLFPFLLAEALPPFSFW